MRLGALFSPGKDSVYSIYKIKQEGHKMVCLITLRSEDSFMFRTRDIELVRLQSECLNIPLVELSVSDKNKELDTLKELMKKARDEHKLQGIIVGIVNADHQKEKITAIAKRLNLKVFFPLLNKNEMDLFEEAINSNFDIILTSISSNKLDSSWLNRKITLTDINTLRKLNVKGDQSDFETLVLDGPMFKQKLEIVRSEIIKEDKYDHKLLIEHTRIKDK